MIKIKLRKGICFAIAALFIMLCADAEAQRYRKRYNKRGPSLDFRIGLRAGANFASFSGDQFVFERENGIQTTPFPERIYDYTIGYHGGAFLDILFKRNVHLQPEFNYSRIGAAFQTPIAIPSQMGAPILKNYDTEILLDYVQFNLLAKLGLGKSDKFRFIIGPGVMFKNSELVAFTYPVEVEEADQLVSPTFNIYSGTDVFATGGFEYQMDLGVSIGFRFTQGFFDIYENPINSDFQLVNLDILDVHPKNYNRYVSFSLGYTFNHYKRLFLTRKGKRFTFKKRRF